MNSYIADLHLGHANAISFDHRPFETVEEMNEAMDDAGWVPKE